MRWEALFEDLEAQVEAVERADQESELRDRARAELARVRLVDRLRAGVDRELDLQLRGGFRERGRLLRVGADWLLLAPEPGRETLVPLPAVVAIAGLARAATEPGSEGRVAARLDLRVALRAVTRDRAPVVVGLENGSVLTVLLRGVGADLVEVAEDARGEPFLLPLSALVLLRRSGASID